MTVQGDSHVMDDFPGMLGKGIVSAAPCRVIHAPEDLARAAINQTDRDADDGVGAAAQRDGFFLPGGAIATGTEPAGRSDGDVGTRVAEIEADAM